MPRKNVSGNDDGNILIMSVVITALLVATGLGYMQWASSEKWDSEYEQATIQAYFLAQHGLIDKGLEYLRTRQPTDLPQGTVLLPPPPPVRGVGRVHGVKVRRVVSLGDGNVFQRADTYDIYATGRVEFKGQNKRTFFQPWRRASNDYAVVDRTATLRARLRSFANYMYLTNLEATGYNEIIWFWTGDTLWGRTHSNDFIGLKYSPIFYGPISTSQDRFLYYNPQNIYFAYPPQFGVPKVNFPTTANTLRAGANPFIADANGRMMTWIKMRGERGIDIYQYPLGSAPRESLLMHLAIIPWGAIFVDGQVELEGTVVGKMSIGSSGNMWLLDDIKYAGSNPRTGFFGDETPNEAGMQHMLGLVSEGNIIIKNNWKNGKENGVQVQPGNYDRHSIAINAGMVALGQRITYPNRSGFTFEWQNDDWELYQGPTPDERGWIFLKGAVTMWRRGYVHRSNHIGTGYLKAYHYDFRFDRRPPPFYLEAVDENGHGLFDIISWGEQRPQRN
ncbi:MAG: hypothetical protein FJY67_04795 [Calditrichaeota bacterium]|nr:hypothetical protein [Calditrichota bacterium]